mmetsp:Transcript_71400/g.220507  ORF Transcript_71400/g.220507 Transcript_71400/m.220507 type:complete len:89 (-) Transcript_71400:1682-1948(-)
MSAHRGLGTEGLKSLASLLLLSAREEAAGTFGEGEQEPAGETAGVPPAAAASAFLRRASFCFFLSFSSPSGQMWQRLQLAPFVHPEAL